MQKVNLSRLDNMIRVQGEELRQLVEQVSQIRLVENVRVYEGTKDFDDEFASLNRAKEKFFSIYQEIEDRSRYIAYLRDAKGRANFEHGVALLLARKSACEMMRSHLKTMKRMAESGGGMGLRTIQAIPMTRVKEPDYYKQAFTENSRTVDITISAMDEADLECLDKSMKNVNEALQGTLDELATLNQGTFIEIKTLEEFCG